MKGREMFNSTGCRAGRAHGFRRPVAARTLAVSALGISLCLAFTAAGGAAGASAQASKGSASSSIAQYKKQIDSYLPEPKFQAPGPPLDAAKVKGKTIMAVVTDEAIPILVGILHGVEAGGAAAGLTVDSFNGNGAVTTQEKGVQEAISEHAAAIVTVGIESSTIASALTAAKNAKIPVVAVAGQRPDFSETGQGAGPDDFGEIALNYGLIAQISTEDAIVDGNGKVDAALLGFPDNANSTWESGYVKSTLAKCSQCKLLKTDTISVAKWSTTVTPEVEALIREYPNLNTIITDADSQAIFAADAIKTAGATGKVHVYTIDGSVGAALKATATGSVVVADPGGSGLALGWASVDQALRAMLSMKAATSYVPFRFLDSSNLSGNVTSTTAVYGSSFVKGFEKLWGV